MRAHAVSTLLHLRAAGRLLRRGGAPLRTRLSPLDERLIFVIGSPRSGTTFVGRSLGSLPGFLDLGEVPPLKAAIPDLAALPPAEAGRRARRVLAVTRRLGLVGGLRAVEQTPECAFVAEGLALAFPQARFVHVVRDGRDVACSLLERGWLRAGRGGEDDARLPYGAQARFWVEPERRAEFEAASDARRAAWAWRRYVAAARRVGERSVEVRYERLAADPGGVAAEVAAALDAPSEPLAEALRAAHAMSVARYRRDLDEGELADVVDEAGPLLRELGYLID